MTWEVRACGVSARACRGKRGHTQGKKRRGSREEDGSTVATGPSAKATAFATGEDERSGAPKPPKILVGVL